MLIEFWVGHGLFRVLICAGIWKREGGKGKGRSNFNLGCKSTVCTEEIMKVCAGVFVRLWGMAVPAPDYIFFGVL